MTIEELSLDVHTFNIVKRAGVNTIEDLQAKIVDDPDDLRRNTGYATFAKLKKLVEIMGASTDEEVSEETLAEPEEKNMIEITTKCPPAPAEPTTPEYLAAFNLNARIHYCKDSVERGLAEMCIDIEQMRSEKQYKQLGYQNFEDYCLNEFGFSDRQGRKADTSKEIEKLRQELEDEKLRAETIKKQADALKDEQEKKRLDLMKRHDQELKKLREGYEKQIADAGIDDESKRKIDDEAYIKALTQQFEDVVNVLEEWIEDLPPDDVLRHMKHIDEYYRKNLRYLMYQKGVED